jgi:hypothetical protein
LDENEDHEDALVSGGAEENEEEEAELVEMVEEEEDDEDDMGGIRMAIAPWIRSPITLSAAIH